MSTISKLNVDAIIDKSITSDKLADDFMLLSDALENEEVTAAALTELNNTKADKTTIDEITQALASKADAEAVSALQQDLDSKAGASELNNYLPLSGGILTGNFQINGKLTIPGLESNNDYIESVRYVNGLWGTESGKSPEMTHDLASIKNAIKFNWYNDDWIIGNIRAGSASSDGFGIGMEKTKSDGTTIYQKNIFRLSPDGEIYLNGTPLANKYLSLSGGNMTGAISGLTSLTSAGNITATEYGFRLSSTEYDGYIWNTVAGKAIAIGVIDNGSTNSTNASLVINGTNIYPGTSNKFSLGTDSYKFKDIYGTNFWGNAQNATNDSSGNKIVDTYALASTCYGGPEGKFAIGNSDNLIGKALTGSWGIYNKYHDVVISEYDASTNTWVEKFNSTTLTAGSANYNAFVKGEKGNFYTSTRGSKVKLTVTSNAGSVYVQAIGLYLKTKDTTYNGNIDYSYWTNGGVVHYSDVNGTWGSWCNITMSGTYRTAFEIFFNEGGANAQIAINGFRIATQTDGIVPVLIGKSHESYKADHATNASTADTASTATKVGDNTLQLYAQSGNEINFGGTNTTNPSIIFGYKSADGNQIVPTQYKFGKDATASVYASKFITTGGTASQVVLGDGTLKNVSELGSSSLTYVTLSNTNIINAGFNYNNTYSGLTIDTYTGFTMDTPDTVIVSAYPITFAGSCMKMEGIENLSGTYYIYCLSYMANGLIAINGAVYN